MSNISCLLASDYKNYYNSLVKVSFDILLTIMGSTISCFLCLDYMQTFTNILKCLEGDYFLPEIYCNSPYSLSQPASKLPAVAVYYISCSSRAKNSLVNSHYW